MLETMPGTTYPACPTLASDAFSAFTPILNATGGLTLSQLCDLIGLNATTIQNWIKRGWVMNPEGKRYQEVQLARILLINLLRGAMQLDQIVALMAAINGAVADRSDDIVPDSQLYNYFCSILWEVEETQAHAQEELLQMIDSKIASYSGPHVSDKELLRSALLVMVLAYLSYERKKEAEAVFQKIMNGDT